jgi:hypothetical protein
MKIVLDSFTDEELKQCCTRSLQFLDELLVSYFNSDALVSRHFGPGCCYLSHRGVELVDVILIRDYFVIPLPSAMHL